MSTLSEMAEALKQQQSQSHLEESSKVDKSASFLNSFNPVVVKSGFVFDEKAHQSDLAVLVNNPLARAQIDQLALADGPEPVLLGDTSMGLNVEWINWYMKTNSTCAYNAIKEGKRRRRKLLKEYKKTLKVNTAPQA